MARTRNISRIEGTTIPRMNSRSGINMRTMGMRAVERNMQLIIGGIKGPISTKALLQAAEYLHLDMLTTTPTIPKDKGDLRESWYAVPSLSMGTIPAVEAGFTSDYAVYVHEMIDAAYPNPINWTTPGSGAKFFQKAIQRNYQILPSIIRDSIVSDIAKLKAGMTGVNSGRTYNIK